MLTSSRIVVETKDDNIVSKMSSHQFPSLPRSPSRVLFRSAGDELMLAGR